MEHIDELKVVYEGDDTKVDCFNNIKADVYSLQPCDVKDKAENNRNLKGTIDYCLRHPKWHLSLQTHKIIEVR